VMWLFAASVLIAIGFAFPLWLWIVWIFTWSRGLLCHYYKGLVSAILFFFFPLILIVICWEIHANCFSIFNVYLWNMWILALVNFLSRNTSFALIVSRLEFKMHLFGHSGMYPSLEKWMKNYCI
jgi:hypothetical protein